MPQHAVDAIDELLEEVGDMADRASNEIAKQRSNDQQPREAKRSEEREYEDPDKEPLEKQAEYARAASEQLERERSGGLAAERETRFQENRSK